MTLPELLNQLKVRKEYPFIEQLNEISDKLIEQTPHVNDSCAEMLDDFLQFHSVSKRWHSFGLGITLGILLERINTKSGN